MKKTRHLQRLVFRGLLLLAVLAGTAPDDRQGAGTLQQAAHLRTVAALTGPARLLGQSMRLGIFAAFREVNRKGGVHNYHLVLESSDDAYEPESAIANARDFINRFKVFALIGAVGTPRPRRPSPLPLNAAFPSLRLSPAPNSCASPSCAPTSSTCGPRSTRKPTKWWLA